MKCDLCGKGIDRKEDLWVERREKILCVDCARKEPEAAIDITGIELSIKPEITSLYIEGDRLWMTIEAYGEFPLQETMKKLNELLKDKFDVRKETVWHVRIERLGERREPEPEYIPLESGK